MIRTVLPYNKKDMGMDWVPYPLYRCNPGSISDSDITEQSQVLDYFRKGNTAITGEGFHITHN